MPSVSRTVGLAAIIIVLSVSWTCVLGDPTDEQTIIADGNRLRYVARPELGYIVKSQHPTEGIEGASVIRVARRSRREAISIVYKERPATEAERAISEIRNRKDVCYAAPLYCLDREIVGILPEVVVRLRSVESEKDLRVLCADSGWILRRRIMFSEREYLLEIRGCDSESVFRAAQKLNEETFVEWAVVNTVSQSSHRSFSVNTGIPVHVRINTQSETEGPNDPYFPMQWHLQNTGQSGGTPGADIDVLRAWAVTTGDPNVIVAVQDMGVTLDHPDLVGNLVEGYDFFEDDTEPWPESDAGFLEGHGTACAGLVGAVGNNGIGVTGVAWGCGIMPIRVMTWMQSVSEAEMAEAIRWSAIAGADVMSYSWGYSTPRPMIQSAIQDIVRPGGIGRDGKGCIVFVAAGNSGDLIPEADTAAYPEVIAVGATDHNDRRCWYSSYGPQLDLVAPGGGSVEFQNDSLERFMTLSTDLLWTVDIPGYGGFSVFNEDPWLSDYTDRMWGTSGATPIAAGVAALVLSVDLDLTGAEVREIVLESADDLGEPGRDPYYGHGRVDAGAAVETAVKQLFAKRSDIDGDGYVNWADFALLMSRWGQSDCGPDNNWCEGTDIGPVTRNGSVDDLDLAILAENWLATVEVSQSSD